MSSELDRTLPTTTLRALLSSSSSPLPARSRPASPPATRGANQSTDRCQPRWSFWPCGKVPSAGPLARKSGDQLPPQMPRVACSGRSLFDAPSPARFFFLDTAESSQAWQGCSAPNHQHQHAHLPWAQCHLLFRLSPVYASVCVSLSLHL